MNRKEKAKELFLQGYNCAQSLVGAFHDKMGVDFDAAVKISSAFGGGMGRMREVCGAVSGMFIVLSFIEGYVAPDDIVGKKKIYADVQILAEKFKEKNGSIICRELLGLSKVSADSSPNPSIRSDAYYKARPCADKVADAAEILENFLNENNY